MKLGPLAALVLALASTGCGYHAAYGSSDPAYRLTVVATALPEPAPGALQAALAGARAELARNGALAAGSAYPRLVIELVRVDELAAGISVAESKGGVPLARGSAIGVTARGWIEERAGGPPVRETGDVRRVETVAQGQDAVAGLVAAEQGARAAAREAGEAVARRALGIAEPSVAPM